jgi:hypothetical protein
MSGDCPGRCAGGSGKVCKTAEARRAAISSLSGMFLAILWNGLACPKVEAASEPVNYS